MENNTPNGRKRNVVGQGASVHKRGEGLNTGGPVGREDAYAGRKEGSVGSQPVGSRGVTRAGGKGGILVVALVLVLAMILGGGKLFNCSGLTNGGSTGTNTGTNSGGLDVLSSLMGASGSSAFTNGGAVSSGWANVAQSTGSSVTTSTTAGNTGKLNTNVAAEARAKYTSILGNGSDKVTIMVYMCGTDLESKHSMATYDIQEMIQAGANNPNFNIIIYTGGCKQWKNNVVSSSVNQIYQIAGGGLNRLVDNDGSASMTNPQTLVRFINFCTQNFAANRYGLILWDHGGGSVSGYGYDEKNASSGSMSLRGINEALRSANTKFDFIGFDACLMATLENALMLEPYADYLFASEETEPGVGWYYTNWVREFSKNTSMTTLELGKQIVDDFVTVCAQKCAGQKTTLSVVDLAELGATVPSVFNSFSVATTNQIKSDYQSVSDARNNTREFATSSKIDQIDLVHLAYNLGTPESKALANAILSAVKYNRTSSDMTNCYGLSIFFPYRKSSKVDSAVATYQAIGLDSAYSRCIQQFASMGVAGQAVGSNASYGSMQQSSPLGSLLGQTGSGSGQQSSGDIGSLLGGLLGGGDMLSTLLGGGSSGFFGRSMEDVDGAAQYISEHQFNPNNLVWTRSGSGYVMNLGKDQWNLVHGLLLNVFVDDGEGYIDLGLDNIYSFTNDGALVGAYDGIWLGIDSQPVAYYFLDSCTNDGVEVITGRVPCLINGDRANLILVCTNGTWSIAGARYDYINGETDTIAKGVTELEEGDTIDMLCDYYSYDGDYQNSYMLGEQIVYTGSNVVGDFQFDETFVATYLFTDIYAQEYWTPAIP